MKDKSEADRRFKLYIEAVDFMLSFHKKALLASLCVVLHINPIKNRVKRNTNQAKALYWRELVRARAIDYEYYSEHPLPKATRRSLKLP